MNMVDFNILQSSNLMKKFGYNTSVLQLALSYSAEQYRINRAFVRVLQFSAADFFHHVEC